MTQEGVKASAICWDYPVTVTGFAAALKITELSDKAPFQSDPRPPLRGPLRGKPSFPKGRAVFLDSTRALAPGEGGPLAVLSSAATGRVRVFPSWSQCPHLALSLAKLFRSTLENREEASWQQQR
jgi:hypothetical protein